MSNQTDDRHALNPETDRSEPAAKPRRRRLGSRFMMLARRTHLYAGLFLLPWVFLYGITGAMFNHQGLFPHLEFSTVPEAVVSSSGMSQFPAPETLATQVLENIQNHDPSINIRLAQQPRAEFTNDVMFEVHAEGHKHVVHIDPAANAATIAKHPAENEKPQRRLPELHHLQLDPDPMEVARESAKQILAESGIESHSAPQPFGWTKLNFLATLEDQPVRITYVLKDGHLDVTEYEGHHGMNPRAFFLRLHTTHGQPPHFNARMIWSLFVDLMAIAMVTWGLTGLLMWWQIKRTRLIGALVMASSVVVAATVYLMVSGFYARTML